MSLADRIAALPDGGFFGFIKEYYVQIFDLIDSIIAFFKSAFAAE